VTQFHTPESGEDRSSARKGRKWGRNLLRWALWLSALLAAVVFAAVLAARSERGREWARLTLEQQLSQRCDRAVTVGQVRYGFLNPFVEVESLRMAGADARSRPFFEVERLRLELGPAELLRGRWRLRQVIAARPRLSLAVDEQGRWNLPHCQATGRPGSSVAMDSLVVEDGELFLQELRLPLSLRAKEFRSQLLEDGPQALSGQLTAKEVLLDLPRAEPYAVDVLAHGRLTRDELQLSSVRTRGEGLEARWNGTLRWTSPTETGKVAEVAPPAESAEPIGPTGLADDGSPPGPSSSRAPASLVADLAVTTRGRAEVLSRLGLLDGEIFGPVQSRGRFLWAQGQWSYQGTLRSPALRWQDLPIQDLVADLAIEEKRLRLEIEQARYAEGSVSGWIAADLGDPDFPLEVDLDVADLKVDRLLADRGVPLSGFAARVSGEIDYRSTRQGRDQGSGWGELQIRPEAGGTLAWTGDLPFVIERGRLSSAATLLISQHHRVQVSGEIGLTGRSGQLEFQVETQEAGELARLLLPYLGRDADAAWIPVRGHGTVSGSLEVDPAGVVTVAAGLDLAAVTTPELSADTLKGSFRAGPVGIESLHLELGREGGALLITGGTLTDPAAKDDRTLVALDFDAVGWPLEEIRSWRRLELPLAGPVSGRLSLDGGGDDLQGRFVGSLDPSRFGEKEIGRLRGEVRWDSAAVNLAEMELDSGAGPLHFAGRIDLGTRELDLKLEPSTLDLAQEPFLALHLGRLGGRLGLSGQLAGTMDQPSADALLEFSDIELGGRALEAARPSRLNLRWRGDRVEAQGDLLGLLTVEGGGTLTRGAVAVELAVEGPQLRPLVELALDRPLPGLEGALGGRLSIVGSTSQPRELRWDLLLPRLRASYEGHQVEPLEPVHVQWDARRLEIRSFFLGEAGGDSEIFAAGSVTLEGSPTLDINLQGSFDSRWLQPLLASVELPEELDLRGRVEILGNLLGSFEDPRFDGQGLIKVEPFVVPYLPQPVEGFEAQISFYPQRIEVESFQGRSGDGRLRGRGTLDLSTPAPRNARLYAQLEDFKLLFPEGWLQQGDAELFWTSRQGSQELQGTIDLEQVRYLEDVELGLVQAVQQLLEPQRLEVGSTKEWLTATRLNLVVRAPNALRIRNRAANLRGDLDLEVRGNLARPILLGTAVIQPGGKLRYEDNEYTVQRGLVTFNNPFSYEPVIDLAATARVRLYEITLNLSGTPEKLDFSAVSDPPLPQLDVIALVAGGRAPNPGAEQILPGSRKEGQLNASAFLSGQAASVISERVSGLFGFDRFRVEPLAEGSDTVSSVRVSVGKRLSKDLFVTYSRDPSTTEQDILEAEWQISPQLVLVFTQNGDGSFSVDALWDRRF
jgi:hypothetical protein